MAIAIKPKRKFTSGTPTTGDIVEGELAVNTFDQKIWVRDDANNIVQVGGVGGSVTISETAPGSPSSGDLWWDSTDDDANLKIYYTDATPTSQWVTATVAGGQVSGADTQIQFNDSGQFGADAAFIWDGTSLSATNIKISDGGDIGSNSDPDAISISGGGVVTFSQAPSFSSGITDAGTIAAGTWNGTAIGDSYISSAATWNALVSSPITALNNATEKEFVVIGATTTELDSKSNILYSEDSPHYATIELSGTSANAVAGPVFRTYRNSASPAAWDYLGQFAYFGQDSGGAKTEYATIEGRIVSPTAGAEYGQIEIHTIANASNGMRFAFRDDLFQLTNEQGIQWWEHGGTSYDVNLVAATPSADRTITFPDATGTAITTGNLTDITTVGTIGTGTWNGTAVEEIYGGTNQTTYTKGDILFASGSNTLSKLGVGSDTQVLTLASGEPTWAAAGGGGGITTGKAIAMAMVFG